MVINLDVLPEGTTPTAFDSTGQPCGAATGSKEPPPVVRLQLLDGATLAGVSVLLEAQIIQAQTLREVRMSVSNDSGSMTFPMPFSGTKPYYRVSPMHFSAENLVLGPNTLRLIAEDWDGHATSSEVTVTRVPVEGRSS